MKQSNLKSKIFLDSGDPNETRKLLDLLGNLSGQTTNPTLISKNPEAKKRLEQGKKFTKDEIYGFYKQVVEEISTLLPQGSISIEVYADYKTQAHDMLAQGREMFRWIPNAHIKFPITREGLIAANQAVKEKMRVNMTLCFSQEQAAAVYDATKGSRVPSLTGFKNVFVSPFVGRLDDRGENGMDLIKNIVEMYKGGDGHAAVLTASVRNLNHLLYALKLESDIITAPFAILQEWVEKGMQMPNDDFSYDTSNLAPIPYKQLDLHKDWQELNIKHELTDIGIKRFSDDWNQLI